MPDVDRSLAGEAQTEDRSERTEERRSSLTVLNVVKQYTEPFILKYGKTVAAQVESTLARLGFCRTAPMGGRVYRCPSCDVGTGQKVSKVRMRDGARVSDPPPKLAGIILWRAPALMVAPRREWLTMRKIFARSAHPKSPQSNTEDKSSGLDIGHNQAIRTVAIGWTGGPQLAGKHAASMLQMLQPVC